LKARAQTADDVSRRTDQKVVEDFNGFRVESLQLTQAFPEHAEFLGWG
jgi:hypothetical protein